MGLRQLMAASLAAMLAIGGSPILLAQQGALGGKATDEAKKPYTDYSVRLREPQTGQVFGTQTLTTDGQFSFTGLTLGQNYIVDSFMVVVTGGVGKLAGTVVASFGIGGLNKLLEPSLGAVYGKVCILVLVILFLQWRPSGLFAIKGRHADT